MPLTIMAPTTGKIGAACRSHRTFHSGRDLVLTRRLGDSVPQYLMATASGYTRWTIVRGHWRAVTCGYVDEPYSVEECRASAGEGKCQKSS